MQVLPAVFAPAQHHAAVRLTARATAAGRTAAPGDLVHITFDQGGASQRYGQDSAQTRPKLEEIATEPTERFVRYADDCDIYVRSARAGQRVMESVTGFITQRLKLKVNQAKSAVARPQEWKFLGFSFTCNREPKRCLAPKVLLRFKQRVRELTCWTRRVRLEARVAEFSTYLQGWRGYFGFCQTPWVLVHLDSWLHRRLRTVVWKQWKRFGIRVKELHKRGAGCDWAVRTASSGLGPWRLSHDPTICQALPNAFFDTLGLPRLAAGS